MALTVSAGLLPGAAAAAIFANSAPITIKDSAADCSGLDQAEASPYPAQIQVSGQQGTVSDVNATIHGFSHASPSDVRMLLVGPHGQSTLLLQNADAGAQPVSNATITFDDAAPTIVPNPISSGTFKPSQESDGCGFPNNLDFPAPAQPAPYGTNLAGFNGTDPNGSWSLDVVDALAADSGSISGGWSLDLAGVSPVPQAPVPQAKGENPRCKKKAKKKHWSKKKLKKCKKKAKKLSV